MSRASHLALAWVSLYTRGVQPERRSDRIDELTSDLWEQERHGDASGERRLRTAVAIVGRVVRGVPADIAWRHAHRRGLTPSGVARSIGYAVFGAATALLLVFTGSGGIRVTGLFPVEDWEPGDARIFAREAAVLFVALASGLVLLVRRPLAGVLLVAVGAFGAASFAWCLAPVLGTAAFVTTGGAVVSARARRRALRSRSASSPP